MACINVLMALTGKQNCFHIKLRKFEGILSWCNNTRIYIHFKQYPNWHLYGKIKNIYIISDSPYNLNTDEQNHVSVQIYLKLRLDTISSMEYTSNVYIN